MSASINKILSKDTEEVCGVTIEYLSSCDSHSKNRWESVIKELLPKFSSHNLVNDLNKIVVGEDIVRFGAGACFENEKMIQINKNPETNGVQVVSALDKGILIHELIHHVDFKSRSASYEKIDESTMNKIKRDVSEYAGTNLIEAIAEIGTGIIIGKEYPDYVHDFYDKYDGPTEVYDIGKEV